MDDEIFFTGELVEFRFAGEAVEALIRNICGSGPYRVLFVDDIEDGPAIVWVGPPDTNPDIVARFIPSEWKYEDTRSFNIGVIPTGYLRHVRN